MAVKLNVWFQQLYLWGMVFFLSSLSSIYWMSLVQLSQRIRNSVNVCASDSGNEVIMNTEHSARCLCTFYNLTFASLATSSHASTLRTLRTTFTSEKITVRVQQAWRNAARYQNDLISCAFASRLRHSYVDYSIYVHTTVPKSVADAT